MTDPTANPVGTQVRVVAATSLLYGLLFFDRLAPLYLVVVLRDELDVGAGSLGWLPVAIGLGWAGAMALARLLRDHLSNRTRVLVGATAGSLVHLAALAIGGWPALIVGRFVGALLHGSVAPSVTATVFRFCPPARRGRAIGIVFSGTRLFGSLIAPVVVLGVAVRAGWQAGLVVSACLALVAMATFALLVPADPSPRVQAAAASHGRRARPPRAVLHPRGRRNIALATVMSTMLVSWLIVVSQSGPTVLVDALGVTPDQAGVIVGAFGVGAWLAAFLVPALSDRIGRGAAASTACAIGGTAGLAVSVVLGTATDAVLLPAALFTLGGVALGALPMAISMVPAESVRDGDPGGAITWPVVSAELIGAALLPGIALAGLVADRASLMGASIGLLLAALVATAIARHDPPEPAGTA